MSKLKDELKQFPYGSSFHNYDEDSVEWIKERAVVYVNDTYDKLSLRRDSITTEEGHIIKCTLSAICEIEWRLEKFNLNDDDVTYLYLKDGGRVFEKVSRIKEILIKMKDRFIQLNEKRDKYLRDIERCTDKDKLLEMDMDW